MDKHQKELLYVMLIKLSEAKTYTNISIVLSLLLMVEFVLVLFGYGEFGFIFFSMVIITIIGNRHMSLKHKTTMEEYYELKKEYEDLL